MKLSYLGIGVLVLLNVAVGKKFQKDEKPDWAKKDIRDFDDADLERLYDQWEVSDASVVTITLSISAVKTTTFELNLNYRKMTSHYLPMSFQNI